MDNLKIKYIKIFMRIIKEKNVYHLKDCDTPKIIHNYLPHLWCLESFKSNILNINSEYKKSILNLYVKDIKLYFIENKIYNLNKYDYFMIIKSIRENNLTLTLSHILINKGYSIYNITKELNNFFNRKYDV